MTSRRISLPKEKNKKDNKCWTTINLIIIIIKSSMSNNEELNWSLSMCNPPFYMGNLFTVTNQVWELNHPLFFSSCRYTYIFFFLYIMCILCATLSVYVYDDMQVIGQLSMPLGMDDWPGVIPVHLPSSSSVSYLFTYNLTFYHWNWKWNVYSNSNNKN